MEKITTNKKFIIKSEDSFGEKTFETVQGTLNISEIEKSREYFYKSKAEECKILYKDEVLSVSRKGLFDLNFNVFFNGQRSKFLYETEIFKQEFYVFGENIFYDEKNKIFSFTYKLFDVNEQELNKISLSIKEM